MVGAYLHMRPEYMGFGVSVKTSFSVSRSRSRGRNVETCDSRKQPKAVLVSDGGDVGE